jgi:hypothetical protein
MVTDQTNPAAIGYAIRLKNKNLAGTTEASKETAFVLHNISQGLTIPNKSSE